MYFRVEYAYNLVSLFADGPSWLILLIHLYVTVYICFPFQTIVADFNVWRFSIKPVNPSLDTEIQILARLKDTEMEENMLSTVFSIRSG